MFAERCTHCVAKKFPVPPSNALQLCQILADFPNFRTAEKRMKFAANPYDITHFILLGVLLHYLRKLKIQIFCKYSADIEENANKLHFKCTDFNSSMRVTV